MILASPERPMNRVVALVLLAAALAGTACRSRSGPPGETGELRVSLALGAGTGATAWVHVRGTTAHGGPWDQWVPAAADATGYSAGVARLPTGTYAVGARVFAGAPADPATDVPDWLTTADVSVVVLARTSQTLALTLQQNPARFPPVRADNTAPTVHGLVASSSTVDSGDPAAALDVAATASDPDPGDLVSFAWTAVDATTHAGVGAFVAPAAASTRWVPPPLHQGTVVVTVTASDSHGASADLSLPVQVSPRAGAGSIVVDLGLNHAPEVSRVDVAHAQLAPLEATTLTAIATDRDGDTLSYAWSDGGCGGSFDAQGGPATTWHAPAADTACTITVVVTDLDRTSGAPRGASTPSTVVVHVVTLSGASAPEFVLATQAPASPVTAGPVWFHVVAVQATPDSAVTVPVTAISWADGTGRADAFVPLVAGAWDAVAWTPPPCAAGGPRTVPLAVTATATGASADPLAPPRQSSFTFSVDLQCP